MVYSETGDTGALEIDPDDVPADDWVAVVVFAGTARRSSGARVFSSGYTTSWDVGRAVYGLTPVGSDPVSTNRWNPASESNAFSTLSCSASFSRLRLRFLRNIRHSTSNMAIKHPVTVPMMIGIAGFLEPPSTGKVGTEVAATELLTTDSDTVGIISVFDVKNGSSLEVLWGLEDVNENPSEDENESEPVIMDASMNGMEADRVKAGRKDDAVGEKTELELPGKKANEELELLVVGNEDDDLLTARVIVKHLR